MFDKVLKLTGISLIAAIALNSCAALDSLSGGKEIEGWQTSEDGTVDTFYMKITGAASELSVSKNNQSMMQATCVEATRLQASDNIIRKMLGETVEAEAGTLDGQTTGVVISSVRGGLIRGTEIKECAPRGKDDSWAECECIHFVKGKDLKKKFQLEVTKANDGE